MNAVGIDVSKGKSTVAVFRPFGEVVASPFDVIHNGTDLQRLVNLIKALPGESKVVMEYTSTYFDPILVLRWEDCDFEQNIISINHTLTYRKFTDESCHYATTTPKTKSGERIIPMLSDVKEALKTEYRQQLEDGFNESVIDGYSGFVFKSRYNTVLSPHDVNRVLDRIIKAYNTQEEQAAKKERRKPELLPHFSCHNLRHTFCTRFCENETNLKIIQEIMGHADITTTMDIYNEATKEKKLESFAGLEGKIKIK